MHEAATTNAAVTAILSTSDRTRSRSGDIRTRAGAAGRGGPYPIDRGASAAAMQSSHAQSSHAQRSRAIHAHLDRRAALDGLIDHAITLGQLEQLVQLVLRRVGVEVELQPDLRKADRRI